MSKLFTSNPEDTYTFPFCYRAKKVGSNGEETIDICDNPKDEDVPSGFLPGKIFIRKPNWAVTNDLLFMCGSVDSFTKNIKIDEHKHRNEKIRKLFYGIEDAEGAMHRATEDFICALNPVLALFILEKIDLVLRTKEVEGGMSKQEAREFGLEVYKYLKKKKEKDEGVLGVVVPPMPSIILITQLCERFHITPEMARTIHSRDSEMMSIVEEQKDVLNNPDKYGRGRKDAHVQFH